jgi:subtilisin family serine protease
VFRGFAPAPHRTYPGTFVTLLINGIAGSIRRPLRIVLAATICAAVLAAWSVASAQALTPDDPLYPQQYALPIISAPAAWDLTTGSKAVKVAEVDDGYNPGHTDLVPNIDAALQKDFGDNDNDASEGTNVTYDSGHGSQTASILGSASNNGAGMTGMDWNADIIPVRVRHTDVNATPGTSRGALITPQAEQQGFAYAAAQGARVVNASFSNSGSARSVADRDALNQIMLNAPNTLFVVSAGNNSTGGSDNDAFPRYPCNLPAPNLVCVGGSDEADGLWVNGNYGAVSVDLAAPAENILSTQIQPGHVTGDTNEYVRDPNDGTSYAAPMVSGTAALYFARFPNATPADAKAALINGVDQKASMAGKNVAGGRLNARKTLEIRPAGTTPPAPDVTPASGLYNSDQQVTMSDTEPGTTIRYTVGTTASPPADPTAADTAYTAPITVSSDQVIKAAAFDPLGVKSPTTQRDYQIDKTPPPAPSVSPASGTYNDSQQVTMSDTEGGATIRYTVGTAASPPADPTASDTAYSAPFTISSDRVIKAAAFDAAGNSSPVTQRDYTIHDTTPPPSPSVNPATGTYNDSAQITMSDTEAGSTIRYTVGDGTTVPAAPTASSTAYTGPITINSSKVIRAAAFDSVGNASTATTRTYTIKDTIPPPAPDLSPASGTYVGAQQLTMGDSEGGATIRYTVGSGTAVPADPTSSSTAYTGPIAVSSSRIVKARAFDAAGNPSGVVRRDYTIVPPDTTPPPAPLISLPSGTYTKAQKVTLTSPEQGATIRYTVGQGTRVPPDPTATTGTQYSGPLTVASSEVLKVAAFDPAGNRSPVKQRDYKISILTAPSTQKLATVLKKGLLVSITAPSSARVDMSVKLATRDARRLRISTLLAKASRRRVSGTKRVRLRFKRSSIARLRGRTRLKLRVTVKTSGRGLPTLTSSRTVVLKR